MSFVLEVFEHTSKDISIEMKSIKTEKKNNDLVKDEHNINALNIKFMNTIH